MIPLCEKLSGYMLLCEIMKMLKADNKEPITKGSLNSAIVLIPRVSGQLPNNNTMVRSYLDSAIDACLQVSASEEAITAARKDIIINALTLLKKALADVLYDDLGEESFTVSSEQEFGTLRSIIAMKHLGEEFV